MEPAIGGDADEKPGNEQEEKQGNERAQDQQHVARDLPNP
jgi:hypothetical protein